MSNKSKFISWSKLLKRWEIEDFELLEYFKEGLQPYLKLGKEGQLVYCPYEHHLYFVKLKLYENTNKVLNELEELDDLEKKAEKTKSKPFYVKRFPFILHSYLYDHNNFQLLFDFYFFLL